MQQANDGMNIVLLSDDSLDRMVRLAVASLYGAVVHQVRSIPAALAQLASRTPVACILVQAGRCTDSVRELASLSRTDRSLPAPVIILGADADAPPDAAILPDATIESLSRLLANIECANGSLAKEALGSHDVPGALNTSRLFTRYQPIVSVADRRPFALEVLARLEHPRLGTLEPAQFVPQLEDAGLARQLTEAVIEAALEDQATHLHRFHLALTLNFPLDVLMRHDIADWLEHRRVLAGVPAGCLIVELTESQPVAYLDSEGHRALSRAMAHMRNLGYRLAIDDFGPEMPRRHELFALPFDLLKLDKAVVNDPVHAGIVDQAVAAAHAQGLKVIAEGVEEAPIWERMQEQGVDYVQGFLVSRPLPAASIGDWLDGWRHK